jgi:Flp pilus assembly protein TadG
LLSVEIAIVMPLLLTMMFGILDYAWQQWTSETLQQAAAFGARCMGVLESSCESGTTYSATASQTYVQNIALERGITVPTADIVVNNATTCGTGTGFSLVTITYTYKSIVPNFRSAFAPTFTLSANACYPNQP